MEWIEKIVWHDVVTRPPTEEELEEFAEHGLSAEEYPSYVFNCQMPNEDEDILILTKKGWVHQDTCMSDGYCGIYGLIYLDFNGNWDNVIAWAYLPTGKKDEEAANDS